jgi:hypothetical protein
VDRSWKGASPQGRLCGSFGTRGNDPYYGRVAAKSVLDIFYIMNEFARLHLQHALDVSRERLEFLPYKTEVRNGALYLYN